MKTRYITAIAATALVLSGCNRDEIVPGASGDGYLKLEVAGIQTVTAVKGALYNSEKEMLDGGLKEFTVQARNADCSPFVTEQTATYKDNKWSLTPSVQWTGEDTKTFFAYTNLPTGATVDNTFKSDDKSQKLAITSLQTDARNQNDIMLGYYSGDGKVDGKDAHTAQIQFYHPLTAVKICDGGIFVDAINKITLSGIYASGTVDVTYELGIDGTIAPEYDWGTTRTSHTSATLEPKSGDKLEIDPVTKVIGVPFVVIPQDVAAGKVRITLDVTVNVNESKTLAVDVPATTWTAGHTKSYTLSYGSATGYALSVTEWESEAYPVKLEDEVTDLLPGKFSVSATEYVRFSRGNMYYDGNAFKLENDQYSFAGSWDANHVSHFFWSETSSVSYVASYSDSGAAVDGVFFTNDPTDAEKANGTFTVNGVTGKYSTLSSAEWQYLFGSASYANDNRKGKYKYGVTVCGIANCVVLLPDDWQWDENTVGTGFLTDYSEESTVKWSSMEAAGAVCLPAAGYRNPGVQGGGGSGRYWTSSVVGAQSAYNLYFDKDGVTNGNSNGRDWGYSVRLVQKFPKPHEAVKIGDVYWATTNIGANTLKDNGWYFSWGNTTGYVRNGSAWVSVKDGTALPNYNTTNGYKLIGDIPKSAEYDAAQANWGENWRMPKQEDFEALRNACIEEGSGSGTSNLSTLSSSNPDGGVYWLPANQPYLSEYAGVAGCLFVDRSDPSKRVFFPAAGFRKSDGLASEGTTGIYWSSTRKGTTDAYSLLFINYVDPKAGYERNYGFTVRPVMDAE